MGSLAPKSSVASLREWLKERLSPRRQESVGSDETEMTIRRKKNSSTVTSSLPESIEKDYYEHTLSLDQLADLYPLSRINVYRPGRSSGLNQDEALNRLGRDGRNSVCPRDHRSNLWLFLKQFLQLFRFLLLFTAILCFLIFCLDMDKRSHLYLSVILFAVLIAMSMLSYWQEKNSMKQMRGFQSMIAPSCFVVRGGKEHKIDSEALVIGDLVWIRPGTRVPADVRLLFTNDLRLETSWISGEVEPLDYIDEASARDVTALQAQNIAFNGCTCISGEGLGVVIRTGNNTVIGKLVELSSREKPRKSRLSIDHTRFVRFISLLSIVMSGATFLIGIAIARFSNLMNVFINGFLIVMVANVPQGLPVTLTAQLVIVARRMAKTNLFLKKLDISETLGTCSVLLCDKTGVLTENKMTVTDIWFDRKARSVESLIPRKSTLHRRDVHVFEVPLDRLLVTMTLCNRAQVEYVSTGDAEKWRKMSTHAVWSTHLENVNDSDRQIGIHKPKEDEDLHRMFNYSSITGSPTEKALLQFVEEMSSTKCIRSNWEILFEVPFNKTRRYHLVIARDSEDRMVGEDEDTRYYIFLKGAPEEVITKCDAYGTLHGAIPMSDYDLMEFKEAHLNFARNGRSCIAFAYGTFEAPGGTEFSFNIGNYPQECFTFLGMAALYDAPRPDVKASILKARAANIKLHMVTGDHQSTAAAIAQEIGMIEKEDDPNCCVVVGSLLESLTPAEWDTLLSLKHVVFARTTPAHKLKIVEECNRRGEIVASTGDGVLDAPVLKKADLGIAVDAVGSVFAKEAADIVINDGDIRNIMDGIAFGRLLFENLKKTIAYTLTHLMPELFPVMLTFIAGWPLALTTMQVLTIDLITELPPSIALIYEGPERDLMKKPPRKQTSRLVSKALLAYAYVFAGMIITVGCVGAYLSVFWYYGVHPGELFYTVDRHWHEGAEKIFTESGLLYDGKNQLKIQMQASAAWQITLVGAQIIHLWNCRTRRVSIFRHRICNIHAVFAVLLSLILLNIFVYVPGINTIVGAAPPPTFVWLFPLVTGIVLTVYNEIRKYFIRVSPTNDIVRVFKW